MELGQDALREGTQTQDMTGLVPRIGREQISTAEATLKEYKAGKSQLEQRVIDNEQWYRLRHWGQVSKSSNPNDPEPTSAWLLNSIANKHADAMDNYPEPNVLPREQDDEQDAEILSSVLPTVLEQNQYEQAYSDVWWDKLKHGTGIMGVFWDATKQGGLGDISVCPVDILNLYWQPGVTDIQRSRDVFNVNLVDRDIMVERYPQLKDAPGGPSVDVSRYIHDDSIPTDGKVAVVDWYYKRGGETGKTVLHYCKFCAGHVLYASEDDPNYAERGYYDHGEYPFVVDVLFPQKGQPAGFGYLDVMKSPQIYVDKLDQVLLKHGVMGARPRFFIRGDGEINETEFADWTKDFVHYTGSGSPSDAIHPIQIPSLDGDYVTLKQLKIDEMKETSGNRDFSQGGTTSGVTAASAIAALQEAGSKLSRDMIAGSYRAFAQECYLVIELMRQFYTEARTFRIVGKQGEMKFVQFNGLRIAEQPSGDGFSQGYRVPYFDIRVVAQKQSPFSTVAQNERAKELYGMGFFRPDLADQALAALDMMQFEGVEKVRERITQNGTLFQKLQQLTPLVLAMAQQLDALQGTQYTPQVAMILGQTVSAQQPSAGGQEAQSNPLGDALNGARRTTSGEARKSAAQSATPRI